MLTQVEAVIESFRAPSYFSKFFEEQLRKNEDGGGGVRTLYIDRDPSTFQDIARHLQGMRYILPENKSIPNEAIGYHVQPRDGGHYVRIFADAQFYSRNSSSLFLHMPKKLRCPQSPA